MTKLHWIMKFVLCLKDAFPHPDDDSGKLQQYSVKASCLLIGITKNKKILGRVDCASVLSFLVLLSIVKTFNTIMMK